MNFPSMCMNPEKDIGSADDWRSLLHAFQSLPATTVERTFMEVSGYPHYENVCSNILRFFLDPTAEHGLRDMLLSSFLAMAGRGDISVPPDVSISREYPADDQKRIDLVVACDSFVLGVENKIFHWEANDFRNYGRVLDRIGRGKETIKVVLCLRTNPSLPALEGDFVRYQYEQLWGCVRSKLGGYLQQANPKWVTFLLEFMATTTRLSATNMELTKNDHFFIENDSEIEKMIGERNAFLGRLNQKVATLLPAVCAMEEVKRLNRRPWVYARNCLVLDYSVEQSYEIAFDLYIRPGGWELQLFGRNSKSEGKLASALSAPSLVALGADRAPLRGSRHIVQKWPIDTDLGDISDALRKWMRAIEDALAIGGA